MNYVITTMKREQSLPVFKWVLLMINSCIVPAVKEPDPQMTLNCTRIWDRDGLINISMKWTVSSSSSIQAIQLFSIQPLLIDTRQFGLLGGIRIYRNHKLNTEVIRKSIKIKNIILYNNYNQIIDGWIFV